MLPEVRHLVHEKGLEPVDGFQHAGREDVSPLAALVGEGDDGAAVAARRPSPAARAVAARSWR